MGNGLAVPRHSDIPPPPMFPHSEEDTPGAHMHNSSGAGPSTGCISVDQLLRTYSALD